MGASAVFVDVQPVGLIVDHVGFRAQGVEHGGPDHPAGPVGAVQRHLVIVKRPRGHVGQIADIAVPAGIEVHRAADLVLGGEGQLFRLPVDVLFQGVLQIVVHLFALAVQQLDAVVVVRVMAGGNHHAAVEVLRPGDVAYAGGGRDVEQIGVRAGGRDADRQGALIHIGGAAGVLADHDPGLVVQVFLSVIPSEEPAGLESVLRRQHNARLAAETVRTEVFSHFILSFRLNHWHTNGLVRV